MFVYHVQRVTMFLPVTPTHPVMLSLMLYMCSGLYEGWGNTGYSYTFSFTLKISAAHTPASSLTRPQQGFHLKSRVSLSTERFLFKNYNLLIFAGITLVFYEVFGGLEVIKKHETLRSKI